VPPRNPTALAGAIDLLHASELARTIARERRGQSRRVFDLRWNALAIGRERRAVMVHETCAPRPLKPDTTDVFLLWRVRSVVSAFKRTSVPRPENT
jgi:hypothetical protein